MGRPRGIARAQVEELRSRLGNPRWVRRLPSSPRSQVWLAEFDGSAAVVKQITAGPDAEERYHREVTALRLAARVHPPVVPALLAAIPGSRLLVLERLADRRPRSGWVRPWAVTLARLHASTGPADVGTLPAWRGPGPADVRSFLALAAELEVPVPAGAPAELEQLLQRLHQHSGHALLHGDPCPGNDLYADGVARFVDLEQACLGAGLVELAYLRIGFPTCWCVIAVPEDEVRAAEEDYLRTYTSAAGAEPAGDLTDACVAWLISGDALVERARRGAPGVDHLAALVRRDWRWGTVTARQRLAYRLTVVAGLTAGREDLSDLSRLCGGMRARLDERWSVSAPPGP